MSRATPLQTNLYFNPEKYTYEKGCTQKISGLLLPGAMLAASQILPQLG